MNLQEQDYSWIEIEGVRGIYFLEGFENSSNLYYFKEDGMLIDTGNDYTAFLEFNRVGNISEISSVFLTHSHNDHTLGLFDLLRSYEDFDSVNIFVHVSMKDVLEKKIRVFGKNVEIVGLKGGEEIELIDEKYRVLDTPGHTFDHICMYSSENGFLFSGDAVITHPVYDENLGGSLKNFITTLRHLKKLDISYIFPGHGYYAHGEVTKIILEKSYFNAIRDLSPERPLKECAKAALKIGLFEEAEYALNAYLELEDKKDREAIFGLASIKADRGEIKAVEDLLSDYIKNSSEEALYIAGMAAMKAEKFEKAVKYFGKLSEITKDPRYRVIYGSALYESGRVAEAMEIEEFRRIYERVGQNR